MMSRRVQSLSLRSKLSLSFGLMAALLAAVFIAAAAISARAHLRDESGKGLQALAFGLAGDLDRGMNERVTETLRAASQIGTLELYRDPAKLQRWVDEIHRFTPSYAWVGFSSPEGRVIAGSDRVLEGADVLQRPWFPGGAKGLFLGDLHDALLLAQLLPKIDGEPQRFFDISAPVTAEDGALVGVYSVHLSNAWADEVRRGLRSALSQRNGAEALVLSGDGRVVVGPRALIGKPMDLTGVDLAKLAAAPDVAQWTDGLYVTAVVRSAGYGNFPGLGWIAIVRQPLAIANAPVSVLELWLALVGLLAIAMLVGAAGVVATVFTKPVVALTEAAQALAQDRDVAIPRSTLSPELTSLSETLSHLVRRLRQRQVELAGLYAALEQRFDRVADNIPGIVLRQIRPPQGAARFAYVSPPVEAMMGLTRRAIEADPRVFLDRIDTADWPRLDALLNRGPDEAGVATVEIRIDIGNGRVRWLRLNAVASRMDDGGVALDAVAIDITDLKDTESALRHASAAAEQANRAKSEFLAAMSHEIRTPLNGVIGITELLKTTSLTVSQRRFLTLQEEAGKALLAVINDILDFSKLEASRIEIVPALFDVVAMAESCAALLRLTAEEKRIRFDMVVAPDVLRIMLGDSQRIRQVLTNLLSNAIKFTDQGGVTLSLTMCEVGQAPRLRISVRDTGIGISESGQARLFQHFSQVHDSARPRGGTGLGLAISKRLVELMGGTIGVESTLGQGSTFWFELPFKTGLASETDAEAQLAGIGSCRILVADDILTNQVLIEGLLQRDGHSVTLVGDGLAAVEAVERDVFDLILMDMQMPVMDGLEAARRIRALGGAGAVVPIVALTANAMPAQINACLAAGMQSHIAKPIDFDDLRKVIRRWAIRHD